MSYDAWTKQELQILLNQYQFYGENLANNWALPGRSKREVVNKAVELGLETKARALKILSHNRDGRSSGRYSKDEALWDGKIGFMQRKKEHDSEWSVGEISILRGEYRQWGSAIRDLPKRSAEEIAAKARSMRLKGPNGRLWSQEDDVKLRTMYNIQGADIPKLVEKFGKKQVILRAIYLGIERRRLDTVLGTKTTHKYYDDEDDDYIPKKNGAGTKLKQTPLKGPRNNKGDLAIITKAYINDGEYWYFAICDKCKKVMLLSGREALGYKHGTMCRAREVPKFVLLPYKMKDKAKELGISLMKLGYGTAAYRTKKELQQD